MFITLIFIVSIIEAFYGLLQYVGADPFHPGGYQSNESNAIGTFGSENALGNFLAIGLICAVYLLSITKIKLKIMALLIVSALVLTTLILTLSRGAWIACMIGILFLLAPKVSAKLKNSNLLKILIPIAFLLILTISILGIYKINEDSSRGRIYIWKISSAMLKNNPLLGVGYGNYGYQYLNYQADFFENEVNDIYHDKASSLKDAHSEIMHSLAETGIIGFIVFISIFILFFFYSKIILKRVFTPNRSDPQIRILITIVLMISIHSLIDNILHVLPIAMIVYVIFAIISTQIVKNENSGNIATKMLLRINYKRRLFFIIVEVIVVLFNSFLIVKKTKGELLWKKGQDHVYTGNWDEGINKYQKALKYLPYNGELQFHLGAAYSFKGNSKEAIKLLDHSLERFNDKNTYISLGNAYWSLGEYEKAEKQFKTVISMFPQMLTSHYWLACLYYDMGQIGDCFSELQFIIDAEPKILSNEVKSIKNDAVIFLEQLLPQ